MEVLSFIYGYSFDPFGEFFPNIIRKNFDTEQEYEDWCKIKIKEHEDSQARRPIKKPMPADELDYVGFLESELIDPYQLVKNIDHSIGEESVYKWKTKPLMTAGTLHYLHGIEISFKPDQINLILNHLPICTLLNQIPEKTTEAIENWYHSLRGRNSQLAPRIWGIYQKVN